MRNIQNGLRKKTDMFRDQNEIDFYMRMTVIILLHIAVKVLEQFRMNEMEILAHENTRLVGLYRNNVHNLQKDFVPQYFGIASQQGHVDLVMNITDTVYEFLFFCIQYDFFIVL